MWSSIEGVAHVEVLETPQHDWWVVADGRLVGLYLLTEECPDPHGPALDHADELRGSFGMSVLHLGTTWRSAVFDHVEDMSCPRGACCKFQSREGWIEDDDAE